MGSGGGNTTSTVTQSNLPAYARPYYESLMKRGEVESKQNYQPYKGDRIADMSAATKAGLDRASDFGNSPVKLNPTLDVLKSVGGTAGNLGNYAGSNFNAGTFDAGAAQQYMSPYMDAVIGRAQTNAVDNYNQQQAARNLQAAKAGSFGGSRAAVQNSIAENQLQSNLTDIMVQGRQSAYENAQSQYNTDRARALDAAQLNEQSRQFGANLGLEGLQLQRQTALDRIGVMQAGDDMKMQRVKALLGVGQTNEDYQQRELDQRYSDFVNQRDAERANLQFLSSLLQGIPISPNSDVVQTGSQNNLAGILGALGGMKSLNSLGS